MINIEGSKVFGDYYSNLLKHPKANKQDRNVIEMINNTFEVFGSLGTNDPKTLTINGKSIKLNELRDIDLKIFTKFVEKFSDHNVMEEAEAQTMIKKMTQAMKAFGPLAIDKSLEKAKTQLQLNEIIAPHVEEVENDMLVDASKRMRNILVQEQKNAQGLEKEIKKLNEII